MESQTWQWEIKWNYVIILWELRINSQIDTHSNGNYVTMFIYFLRELRESEDFSSQGLLFGSEILRLWCLVGSEAKLLKSNEFSFYLNTDSNRPSALLWGGVDKVSS